MKKRIKKLFKDNEKALTKTEKEIIKNYKKGYRDLDREMARIYKEYANKDGKLYLEEMNKYNRIKKLDTEVAVIIARIYKENIKLTEKLFKDIVKRSYEAVTKEASKQTGRRVPTIAKEVLITDEVEKLIAGINWKDRDRNHQVNLIYKTQGIIKDGLESGKSYTQMAKDIEGILGKDIVNPTRVARTEGHRIMESSKLQASKDLDERGIGMTKTWTTMGDERVRSSHVAMDGATVELDEYFKLLGGAKAQAPGLSGDPGEDVNCRCILTYDIKKKTRKG